MKRFHLRYLAVALALCVMLAGAAIAAASSSVSSGTGAGAEVEDNTAAEARGKAPEHAHRAHAKEKVSALRSLVDVLRKGPAARVLDTPAVHRVAPPSAVRSLLLPGSELLPRQDDRRYQWSGEIRPLDDRFVLYRDCDRWLLDPQSEDAREAIRAHAEAGRVDVWGTLSQDARQTIAADHVYGVNDPRPRILVPDYPCPKNDEPAPSVDWVSGWIGDVDLDNRVVVLRMLENGPMRFLVTGDTSIVLDGQRVRLDALESGMPARVAFEPRTQNALRIMAASEQPAPRPEVDTVGGTINVVNDAGMSLRLHNGSDVRFYFTDDTRIVLDGERVRPSALEAGMTARVTYDVETRNALRIHAVSERPQPRPAPVIEWAGGWIEEVDVENHIVILRQDDGHMRFRVTGETGIGVDLQRAALEDLEPGMAARVAYDPDTQHALRIMAISNSSG